MSVTVPEPPDDGDSNSNALDLRLLRAYQIGQRRRITWMGGYVFHVESQTRDTFYKVELHDDGSISCSCPDWAKRRLIDCKHGKAVKLSIARFTEKQISKWPVGYVLPRFLVPRHLRPAVARIIRMYFPARRRPKVKIIYPKGSQTETGRRKAAYRRMRTRVPELIFQLCNLYEGPRECTHGGQELLLHDKIFSVLFRTFANRSLNDTSHELQEFANRGFIEWAPCQNSLCYYIRDKRLTPIFQNLLVRIARTVRKIERFGTIDASKFSTISAANYLDQKEGRAVEREQNDWLKTHVACGAITGVVAAVIVTWNKRGMKDDDADNPVADTKYFIPLVKRVAEIWKDDNGNPTISHILADKAYLSGDNLAAAIQLGIKALIPIKRRWKPETKSTPYAQELFDFYTDNNPEFEEIYRYRSKIEGVFGAAKRVCGHYTWSRGARLPRDREPTDAEYNRVGVARYNEILAKFIILSLRRLVVLEDLHSIDGRVAVDFSDPEWAFEPLPPEYIVQDVDLDEDSAVQDPGDEPPPAQGGENTAA